MAVTQAPMGAAVCIAASANFNRQISETIPAAAIMA
jgi:hypothetical protein